MLSWEEINLRLQTKRKREERAAEQRRSNQTEISRAESAVADLVHIGQLPEIFTEEATDALRTWAARRRGRKTCEDAFLEALQAMLSRLGIRLADWHTMVLRYHDPEVRARTVPIIADALAKLRRGGLSRVRVADPSLTTGLNKAGKRPKRKRKRKRVTRPRVYGTGQTRKPGSNRS